MSELKPCPICGKELNIHGPEDWTPTFYDPDSGGDPYSADCNCGFAFCNNSYDYKDFVEALNHRAGSCEISEFVEDCDTCGFCKANDPITPDELRQMADTDWVWLVFPELPPEESGWHRAKRTYQTYSHEHYGKTWLAYRRKPERM